MPSTYRVLVSCHKRPHNGTRPGSICRPRPLLLTGVLVAGLLGGIGAAFGIGFILGPAIGGLLGELGPRAPFHAAAAIAAGATPEARA